MRVRFWGTRGSIATPGPGTVRYGGNTSCVEVRSAHGTLLVLDCGTGAYALGRALCAERQPGRAGHMLITHTHWDHIQGLPFFSPLREADEQWHLYGPYGFGPSLEQTLGGQMQYTYFPVTLDQLAASVSWHDLLEGEFELGDIRVTARYLNHPALTLGYRLEADGVVVVYATDHEPHLRDLAAGGEAPPGSEDDRHSQFLADADLVIHDTQYTMEEYPEKTGWGHSTVEYAVDMAREAMARRLVLYHHDPMRDDAGVDGLLARARARVTEARRGPEALAAAEGTDIDLGSRQTSVPVGAPAEATPAAPVTSEVERVRAHGVLVAMDDSAEARRLHEAVRADGMRLLRAQDAASVLRLVERERPALVMLGRRFAGSDALQLCRDVRARGDEHAHGLPLVVVAAAEEISTEAAADPAVTAWLATPFSPHYARSRIRAWALRAALRWKVAPPPPGEAERLQALDALRILDTPAEPRFDRLTRIAAALFDVPIALASLVDAERQWFKSRVGLDVEQTPRDLAFCSHALRGAEVMQVPDTLLDERFADNPMVSGPPHIRFYAGAPLVLSNGHVVGTLCVIDHRPRLLDAEGCAMLSDLAGYVVREMEDTAYTEAGNG